jgi:hypothetical protein
MCQVRGPGPWDMRQAEKRPDHCAADRWASDPIIAAD